MTPLASPAGATSWRAARRILAVRLDNLGDVIMTGPALAAVRAVSDQAHVTLLCSPSGAAAARHMPMIDEAIVYEAPWVKRGDGFDPQAYAQADHAMLERLSEGGFDAAIVFTVATQSALPAALMLTYAGIPLRAAHARENPYALLSDWVRDVDVVEDGMRHEVRRQLDLVKALGFDTASERLVFDYTASDRSAMQAKAARAGLHVGRPYLVVHVGATAASRRYPSEAFREAVALVEASTGLQAVYVGAASEADLVREARGPNEQGVSLVGELGLGELAALIDGAAVMLCNNSGPAHIAAAQGTPTVVLYAMTNPQHTPWEVPCVVLNALVPCRHCLRSRCDQPGHPCLTLVEPAQVARAVAGLLERTVAPVTSPPACRMEA